MCDDRRAVGAVPLTSWNGLISCGEWLNGHWGGSPPGTLARVSFPGGGNLVSEFQCVELATRYALLAWGVPVQPVGHAKLFPQAYNGKIDKNSGQKLVMYGYDSQPSSDHLPQVGDVVASGYNGASNGDGHVGIVISTNYHGNSGTLTLMDENFNPSGLNTMTVTNGVVQPLRGMKGVDWLHDPAGTPPPPPTGGPTLTVHGISDGQSLTGPVPLSVSVDNNNAAGKQNLTHEHFSIDGTVVAGTDNQNQGSLTGPPSGSTAPGYSWTLDPVKHTGSSVKVASWPIPANLLTPGTHRLTADGVNAAGVPGTSPPITFSVPQGPKPSTLTYTGAKTADYHDAFTASATLTSGGSPVAGAPVSFALGNGGAGQTCSAKTDAGGSASCRLTPGQAAGSTTVTATYAGTARILPSHASTPLTITREETSLDYAGPTHFANGVPATLSGVLKEDGAAPIAGRTVSIAIGSGATQQSCTATTDASGDASCAIPSLNQPLSDTATLPVTATFAGDGYYVPANGPATVRLEYFTGQAYGLSAKVNALLLSLRIPPTPDTGPIRTAQAGKTDVPCTATVSVLVINASALCADGTTTLNPGTETTTSTLQQTSIGLPGLPVIGIGGVTSTSVSTCTGSHGSATLTLTIAGVPVTLPTAPNSVIDVAGGAKLIINEQLPIPGADHGLTVNAVHLIALGGLADVVVGSSSSAAYNCA